MRTIQFSILYLSMVLSSQVFADQCNVLHKKYAENAKLLLEKTSQIMHFCAPCDDLKPIPDHFKYVKMVEAKGFAPETYHIKLEKEDSSKVIDLAYIYIPSTDNTPDFENLAMLSGCPVEQVPFAINEKGAIKKQPPFEVTPRIPFDFDTGSNSRSTNDIPIKGISSHNFFYSGQIVLNNNKKIQTSKMSLTGRQLSFEASDELFLYSFHGKFIQTKPDDIESYTLQGTLVWRNQITNQKNEAAILFIPVYVD